MENNNDVTKTPVCSCCCTKHTDRSEAGDEEAGESAEQY